MVNTELSQNLSNAIRSIWDASQGKWVSCLEHPLTTIFKSHNVPKNYFGHITSVLTEHGVFFTEGQRAGMRYKMDSYVDPAALIPKIIEAQKAYTSEYRNSLPKRPRKKETIPEDSPLKVIQRSAIPLGTVAYVLINGIPVKGIISGSELDQNEFHKILYRIRFISTDEVFIRNAQSLNWDINPTSNDHEYDSPWFYPGQVFISMEALVEHIKSKLIGR